MKRLLMEKNGGILPSVTLVFYRNPPVWKLLGFWAWWILYNQNVYGMFMFL